MQIRPAVCEILADEAFTATDGLISQSFVVTFVLPYIYADSPHLGLSSATYFVKIRLLVVEIQAE